MKEKRLPGDFSYLAKDLASAVANQEFEVAYEPIIRLKDERIWGINALARWNHPVYGKIPPLIFIRLAEKSDAINLVGKLILEKACHQFSNWRQQNLVPSILKLGINISLKQVEKEDFLEMVENILTCTHLSPGCLKFQLTESQILDKKLIPMIKAVQAKGIDLILDNFGMPHSNLTYLKFFDIEMIEIDSSFVKEIGTVEGNKWISVYCKGFKSKYPVKILAEGVETKGQLDFLKAQGCDYAVGSYFSEPLDADHFESYLRENKKTLVYLGLL